MDDGVVWEGADALRPHLVPITWVEPHPQNPRIGQVAMIADSLRRFGQVRPILTDGGKIIAGNHTFLAARELGWSHVAAVAHKFADAEEARAYLLADNRLPELGGYQNDQLLSMLQELETLDGWAGTGYGPDDLEDLRAVHDQVPTTAPEDFQGDYAASAEELAARAEQLAGSRTMRELPLTLTAEQSADFDTHAKILRKEYGDVGVTEAVYRAIENQARILNAS